MTGKKDLGCHVKCTKKDMGYCYGLVCREEERNRMPCEVMLFLLLCLLAQMQACMQHLFSFLDFLVFSHDD